MKAVILAGGLGTRISEETKTKPVIAAAIPVTAAVFIKSLLFIDLFMSAPECEYLLIFSVKPKNNKFYQ